MALSRTDLATTVPGVVAALRERIDGEVRFDDGSRAAYSTDASNFRQVPIGVVVPRTIEAAVEAVGVCREHDLPIVNRGGGTSLAGQCTNEAVVLDFTKYCHHVVSVDEESRRCVVEPGIVLDVLNRHLAPTGLRFGPEPATHQNCTLGGMIGNNSCGATAQRTGKVVDNIASLDVLLYDGTRFTARRTDDRDYEVIERTGDRRSQIYRTLRRMREEHADLIRERYPDIPRRVSGYNLDSLLPEHGFDLAGFLVGSESTLVTILHAELELVPVVKERTLVVLGFDNIAAAADAVPDIVEHDPIALEGVDHYLIHDEQLKGMNHQALEELPKGDGYLMVQFGGDTTEEADRRAHAMLDALGETEHDPDVALMDDPTREDELWQVREAGLGATAHVPDRPDTWEGWEDSAVPVDRLGDYLRDLRALYEEFGYASDVGPSLYGHFGQGCVHTRIPFDLYTTEGVATYRRFLERAADLVASYGGSLSGEHGDGQTRGELLPRMFGQEVVELFEDVKALFDPQDRMNPGKVVHPAPLDRHLRFGGHWAPRDLTPLFFAYPDDGHSFGQAASRCVGVGKCRKHENDGGTVMCPSYQVTHEEEHSTRGRARLLFEMLDGHPDGTVTDGWRSQEVKEALDLCLACKGCKSDCPANVDMATYKAEFLAQHYRHRLRPRADYTTGWLPAAAALVARTGTATAINAVTSQRLAARALTRAAGLEPRPIPAFAPETLQQWWRRRGRVAADAHRPATRGRVLLWPDTFTNHFHPQVGRAAVEVLESAGWDVVVPTESLCCGLTWISTGQLGVARRVLRRTIRRLAPHVRSGGLVLGLEPSCTAVFRSDMHELFPDDQDANRLKDHTVTLAELLTQHTDGWAPPRATYDARAIAQVHCHQHAIMKWDADRDLLERAGVDVERLDSGCCGLAGNFGFTAGHGDVSRALAEQTLLPRIRQASDDTVVLADGFSCRTQIHDLDSGGREGVHLAELLADLLRVGQDVTSPPRGGTP
ncbi:FAD-binding and (Fe-S)-binding domain-containing protein [Nocardioides sp.]|jgi:FAD/FMN-containing dehydrogenase/Fe-S oxidoreductase|uniref:FAD-binding and (Fe-S)-binding domain-containing protein n=1 Tax=Nocardioides sp. TaxID=35761 RepID=UPI002F41416F